jgi:hypothetical protein
MYREHQKITRSIENLWSGKYKGELRFPYPGHLYSRKELVIEVPFLTDYSLYYGYRLNRGILTPPIRRIAINIVSSQNPPEELLQCSGPDGDLIFYTGSAYLAMLGLSLETSECNDRRVYGRVTVQFLDKPGRVRRFESRSSYCKTRHGCFHTHHAICTRRTHHGESAIDRHTRICYFNISHRNSEHQNSRWPCHEHRSGVTFQPWRHAPSLSLHRLSCSLQNHTQYPP